MTIDDRLDFSTDIPADDGGNDAFYNGRAPGLIARLQNSNKALENLLHSLEDDESRSRSRVTGRSCDIFV